MKRIGILIRELAPSCGSLSDASPYSFQYVDKALAKS
jgi:hypothetical protein